VDGELAAYDSAIEAAARYYSDGDTLLGATTDWEASQLLDSDGLLATLNSLRETEQAAMNARTSSFWAGPLVVALWVAPALVMLAVLLLAQAYLARRFRRRLSIPLAAATVASLALAGSGVTIAVAERHLTSAQADLATVSLERTTSVEYSDYQGQVATGELVSALCQGHPPGCTPTVFKFRSDYHKATGWTGDVPVPPAGQVAAATDTAMAQLSSADDGYSMQFAIPALGIAIAVLIAAGFQSRIDEYR
jgi:hypothetical protein